MADVVLSAAVRQNLLSLQSTASLLATTQNDLATGNKVNSALDNPTEFFTSQGLNNRASDINNLLDGIGNGVQVLQAANTGITSLQSLVDSAKSIANQVLQSPVGFTTKSNVSTNIAGATAADLRGTTSFVSATAISNILDSGAAGGTTAASLTTTLGSASGVDTGSALQDNSLNNTTALSNAVFSGNVGGVTPVSGATTLGGVSAALAGTVVAFNGDGATKLSAATTLIGGTPATSLASAAQPVAGQTLTVDGHTITFQSGSAPAAGTLTGGSSETGNVVTDGNGNSTVFLGTAGTPAASVGDLLNAIDLATGVQKITSVAAGIATLATSSGVAGNIAAGSGTISLTTGTGADLSIGGSATLLHALGLTPTTTGNATVTQARTTAATTVDNLIQGGSTVTVDGHTITFSNLSPPAASLVAAGSGVAGNVETDGNGNSTVFLQHGTIADVLNAVDLATGVQTASNGGGGATLTVVNPGTAPASSVAASGALKITTGPNVLSISGGAGNAFSALGLSGATSSVSANTLIFGATGALGTQALSKFADGDTFSVNGKTVTVKAAATPTAISITNGSGVSGNVETDGNGNSTVFLNAATTVGDFLKAFDLASGVQTASISAGAATLSTAAGQTASSVNSNGQVVLQSTTGADLNITGKADDLKALGLTSSTGSSNATVQALRTTNANSLGTLIAAGSTLTVDGKTITFSDAATPAANKVANGSGVSGNVVTDGNGNSTVFLQSGTVADVLKAIDLATGVQTASNTGGAATLTTATGQTNSSIAANGTLQLSTGVNADLVATGTGNALSVLGLTGNTGTATSFTAARTTQAGSLNGQTLTFSSFNGGTAVNVTFGDGTNGTIKSLSDLNNALQADNLIASLSNNGVLTISASNDFASSTLGTAASGGVLGGTVTSKLSFSTPLAPVADTAAQATRSALVTQYNNILQQINTTAQDSSFNGVNLLNGDTLKLTFDETAQSTLNIQGVTFSDAGLGLATLTPGVDFQDNNSANKALTALNNAATTLRSEASGLGSNLSIVQICQDFNKNLVNVLQTGASNLVLADPNEEAANSQALSTRQSIAVSALALANQSQQSVLQLLR